jgi:hypothetical protein
MASNANRGVPPLPATLIRPTQPDPVDPDGPAGGDDGQDQGDGQGRGVTEGRAAVAKGRRRRVDRGTEKLGKRGLYLTASVWQRLQLEAIRKGTSVSAVAGDVLERTLPRLRIERD